MSLTKIYLTNELYDSGLITLGAVAVSSASKKNCRWWITICKIASNKAVVVNKQ